MPHEELPSLQRPRYGCKCAGTPGLPPLLGRRLPRNALEKARERVRAAEGTGGDWRGLEGSGCEAAKLGAGVAKGSERRLAAVFTNP